MKELTGFDLLCPFGGGLKDVPFIVIKAMSRYQELQGNIGNLSIFKREIAAGKSQGGFDWIETDEGADIWLHALMFKDFSPFYNFHWYIINNQEDESEPDDGTIDELEWVGKECLFWNDDKDEKYKGILNKVWEDTFVADNSAEYKFCHIVKEKREEQTTKQYSGNF